MKNRLSGYSCFLLAALFFLTSAASLVAQGTAPSKQRLQTPNGLTNIQHFVFILKENRSFDHYFGTFPGADGATTATISTGQVIPISHAPDQLPRDFCHSWQCAVTATDGGRMDKFDVEGGPSISACNLNGDYLCFSQLTQQDIPNYFALASYFALSDHTFSSIHGTSFPNHMYSVAAQAGGMFSQPVLLGTGTSEKGCDSDPGSSVSVMDSQGNTTNPFPCFDFTVLTDSLDAAGVSWKFYAPDGSYWNPLDAINHIRNTPIWTNNVVSDTQFAIDAASGNLPSVSWVVTSGTFSEHPPNSTCLGENWSVQQLNAIMQGPDWNSTAIFLAWDDWDGLYDHVPPPQSDQFGLGPRVPMIIISPYTIPGYITHTPYEFSSYLKLVEERYGLAPLTNRDLSTNDMLDAFDFNQSPLAPLILQTRSCSPSGTSDLHFPPQQLNKPSPAQTVSFTNFGSTPLTISNISTTGDFSQTNTCPRILPVPSPGPHICSINVVFTPTASGTRTGTLTVTDSDPTSPQVTTITGIGSAVTFSTSLLNFGTQLLQRTTAAQTATLTNAGPTAISISSITASGDYSQNNNCGSSLGAGSSCTIFVTFTATAPGVRYGSVTVSDSDGSGSQVLNLTGIGTNVTVSPSSLNFAAVGVGTTSAPQTVTVTNAGSSALNFTGLVLVGSLNQNTVNYAETDNCGSSLQGGASCQVSITFSPHEPLGFQGSLLINDDEIGTTPQIVSLAGTGLANPIPVISLPLIPASVSPGSSSFQVTVNGTGFVSGGTVNWNGSPLSTSLVSASTLTATVPSSNISKPATGIITVSSPAPGGGISNPAYLPVGSPGASVSLTSADVASGSSPHGVIAADFDGNGRLDLAVVNSGSNTLTILLGTGSGTFTQASSPITGSTPVAVASGDFNQDGKLDLVVANSGDNTVSVLLGNRDGSFASAPGSPVAVGLGPGAVAVGDFNKDGRLDIAVADTVESVGSVLLGNGDGTFLPTTAGADTGTTPVAIAVADFNNNGSLDLAIVNQGSNSVSILPGQGEGTFTTSANVATGAGPSALVVADFNGDGRLDLAVANQGDSSTSIALGNGDETFTTQTAIATGSGPMAIATGDFNNDGKLDLFTVNQGGSSVSVLLGNGDGTFQNHIDQAVESSPNAVAIGDFNQDGLADFALTSAGTGSAFVLTQPAQGKVPVASLSTSTLAFGTQVVGTTSTAQMVTLSNIGTATLNIASITASSQFGQTNNCGSSLPFGKSCTVSVTFSPSTTGPLSGTVTITDNAANSPQIITLSGTGAPAGPLASVSPTSLTFPIQLAGTKSAQQNVTLTNTGTSNLTLTGTTVTGPYSKTPLCPGSIAPGKSCTIAVFFGPTSAGVVSGTLSLIDNAPGSPQTVTLSGTGTFLKISPTQIDFGSVRVGKSSNPTKVTLTNTGKSSLTVASISITGSNVGDFSQSNGCTSPLRQNGTCTVSVTFTPKTTGARSANLTMVDGSGVTQSVALSGVGK
jgi:phospholipase C